MKIRAYLEKHLEPHDPDLYRATGEDQGIDGWTALDAAALARYHDQGFLVVRGAIPPDRVARARDELRAMTEADDPHCATVYYEGSTRELLDLANFDPHMPDAPRLEDLRMSEEIDALSQLPPEIRSRAVRKFMGFVDRHEPLAAVANYPLLVDAAARLAGESVRLFQDMAMIKPPSGREKPWHQDHAYFNLPIDTRVVGVWIALSEATRDNGCMHVIPGGHRRGPRPHFARRDWQLCDEHVAGEPCLALPMTAGDLLLFDSKLPHGTPANRTADEWRWALQFHFIPSTASEVDESFRLQAFGTEGKNVTC